jgi:diguanylate cyclase (GGDEF)-like protein
MPAISPEFREFLKKYRIEFIIAAIATILIFEISFAVSGKAIIDSVKEGWGIKGYNILIFILGIIMLSVALISYPKIYKFKILLSAAALASYMLLFTMITNIFPVKISVMDFRLDFYEPAWRDAGRFSNTFLITMLSVNFLIMVLANSTTNYNMGKAAALWAFAGNIALYVLVLFVIEGNYYLDRTTKGAFFRFAGDFVDAFNKYALLLNFLIFLVMAVLSVFNIEEEHNYGSIIMALASLNFYMLLALPYEYGYWKMKIMLPFMAVILIIGIFIHWMSCLHHKAHYDPLLKIYNRQHMDSIISGVADIKLGNAFSVFMCDIDHFKAVNDTYGHAAGDAVLFSVAQIIRDTALPEGVVCRYGGEEIIVFIREKTDDEAVFKAEKIRKAVKNGSVKFKSKTIKVTMSIGVASTKKGLEDIQKMIKRSDDNVYKAKKRGRDRVVAE